VYVFVFLFVFVFVFVFVFTFIVVFVVVFVLVFVFVVVFVRYAQGECVTSNCYVAYARHACAHIEFPMLPFFAAAFLLLLRRGIRKMTDK
jgi:hypothetical protein